jgi:hypothetical protein
LQSRPASFPFRAQVHLQFRSMFHYPIRNFDNFTFRRAESRRSRQLRSQELIGKHANVLRIILKLDHVNVTVSAQHELPLRAAPHSPDLLHRQNRQSFPHLRRYSLEFYAIG